MSLVVRMWCTLRCFHTDSDGSQMTPLSTVGCPCLEKLVQRLKCTPGFVVDWKGHWKCWEIYHLIMSSLTSLSLEVFNGDGNRLIENGKRYKRSSP